MQDSMKALGIEGFKGIETFQSNYGSVYGIIAKNKGLSLSITPKLEIGRTFVSLMIRVRASKAEEWANLEDSLTIFGFPFESRGPDHASVEVYVPVAISPSSPFEVGKIMADNRVVGKVVSEIEKRVKEAGSELLVSADSITEYLTQRLQDFLPNEEPKKITEFKVLVGYGAYKEGKKELKMALFPEKYAPQTEAGGDEAGEGEGEEGDQAA